MIILENITTFFTFALKELKKITIYINTLVIGLIINLIMAKTPFASIIPYLIPIIIQVISRASNNYINRHRMRLLKLPEERHDPAFLINTKGELVLSAGKTKDLFNQLNISTLYQFISEEDAKNIIKAVHADPKKLHTTELYSSIVERWYEAKFKCSKYKKGEHDILIWLSDITERKILEKNISSLLSFSGDTVKHLPDLVENNDILERLASLIIDFGFQGVFIAHDDTSNNLTGHVFKCMKNTLKKSDLIQIPIQSQAPILRSRTLAGVISEDVKDFSSRKEFEKEFPFDMRVKIFLNFPIDNFINYHEGEFSIIAFNKDSISKSDRTFMEILVNHARSVFYLTEQAIDNAEEFIRSVMGLCAASEYSDKTTGKHILRVNEYARVLALKIGLSKEFVKTIGQVAALHDIGKVAIPELIKLKRNYNPEERVKMQMHTLYGAQIIMTMMSYSRKRDKRLEMTLNLALNHHQTWIGSGYPGLKKYGERVDISVKDTQFYQDLTPLKGDEIPVEALITSLADVYDALRSKRQYKDGFSHEETFQLLTMDDRLNIGGPDRFGPDIWDAFLKSQDEFQEIYQTMLDDSN